MTDEIPTPKPGDLTVDAYLDMTKNEGPISEEVKTTVATIMTTPINTTTPLPTLPMLTLQALKDTLKKLLEEADRVKTQGAGRKGFRPLTYNIPFSNGIRFAVKYIEREFP